jgi:urease accessory protein
LAHTGADAGTHHDAVSALWDGFVHPLTGVDHWAAMLALGLWSAMTAKRVVIAPLVFAVMFVVGAMLGFMNAPIAAVEPMIAGSLLVWVS